jgi:hypothetical protein
MSISNFSRQGAGILLLMSLMLLLGSIYNQRPVRNMPPLMEVDYVQLISRRIGSVIHLTSGKQLYVDKNLADIYQYYGDFLCRANGRTLINGLNFKEFRRKCKESNYGCAYMHSGKVVNVSQGFRKDFVRCVKGCFIPIPKETDTENGIFNGFR